MRRWGIRERLQDGEPNLPGGAPPVVKPPEDGPPAPATVSVDVLPEGLRDRPAAEVKFLLDQMINSLGTANNRAETLQQEMAELRGAFGARPVAPVEPDPNDLKPLEELILENAPAAMDRYMRDRGYVGAFDDLSGRVGEAEFSMVAGAVDDFHEYEEDVRTLLKNSKVPQTRQNIMGAYKLAVGERTINERARVARAAAGSIRPSTPPVTPPAGETPELSSLESEIMRAHGMTDAQEWIKYRDNPPAIKLPT